MAEAKTKTNTNTTTKRAPRAKAGEPASAATKLEAAYYSMEGKDLGTITLPAELFGAKWRPDLVHQVTTALAANLRQNRAHTKDRSEVSGGGKKPWKQKGTGQARHGSTRSPIWRHGGITFGPRNTRDYGEKINKKMRREALRSVLSKKLSEGEVLFVDALTFTEPKTATAKRFLATLAQSAKTPSLVSKNKNAVLLAFAAYNANQIKSFRNISNLATEEARNLNALDVLTAKYLIIENPDGAYAALGTEKSKNTHN